MTARSSAGNQSTVTSCRKAASSSRQVLAALKQALQPAADPWSIAALCLLQAQTATLPLYLSFAVIFLDKVLPVSLHRHCLRC